MSRGGGFLWGCCVSYRSGDALWEWRKCSKLEIFLSWFAVNLKKHTHIVSGGSNYYLLPVWPVMADHLEVAELAPGPQRYSLSLSLSFSLSFSLPLSLFSLCVSLSRRDTQTHTHTHTHSERYCHELHWRVWGREIRPMTLRVAA